MSIRLRSLLMNTPVKVILGLVAAWFLFFWFAFEPLLKWAAPKYIADRSRHTLSLEAAQFDPLRLSLELNGLRLSEPDGTPLLAFDELFVDFAAGGLLKRAWSFEEVRLVAPTARVELRADGQLNWTALIEALKGEDEDEDEPLPRLLVRRLALDRGRVEFVDRKAGFETTLNPLDLILTDLSTLEKGKGTYRLSASTRAGEHLSLKGEVTLRPVVAAGELGIEGVTLAHYWPYLAARLNLAPPAGVAGLTLNYRLGHADQRLSLRLDNLGLELKGVALRGKPGAPVAIQLDRLRLTGGRFDLEKRQVVIGGIALNGAKVALRRDRAGRLEVADWFVPSPSPSAATEEKDAAPWRVDLAGVSLDGVALYFNDAGFATPLDARIGNIQAAFTARAESGGVPPRVWLDELGVALSDLRLASGNRSLLTLDGLRLEQGAIDLAAHEIRIGKLALANGKTALRRDARGRIALLEAFKPAPGPRVSGKPARAEAQTPAPGWTYRLDQVGLSGFQVRLRDETVRPAGELSLRRIEATVAGVSDDLDAPLPVKFGFQVREGGRFQATGKVIPARLNGDFRLKLDGLALAPAQPWLSQAASLELASGRASTRGRLRFDGKAASDKRLRFTGGFSVDGLLLKESETGDRFLSWKHLTSDSLGVTPGGLDIDELKLDGLGAKLIIYQDKTVNLKRILRAAAHGGEAGTDAPPARAPDKTAKGAPDRDFRIGIDRVRVEHGEVDFADHSLKLPFGTRVHDFKGSFNGISSQPGAAAELELDGRVDAYGLARVTGRIDLFDPADFMDIRAVFRNVEMANLTPYTATFAGHKIASGKLSLDLEYKIEQRQLLGENQIVMDRVTLGEKLEGPDIKHLPLELAIAILQDAHGRIDLGLPISGSLDDPEFSYGRIIWKAIGNVIGKIVTAPFRALASLFGGSGEKLERIVFEAGDSGLTPPEKEKFKQITQVLAQRPGLALSVRGAWSGAIDRPVLQERQLRRAVAEQMGVKLAPDETAGPISTARPKARAALETLYAARFGEADWETLRAGWLQANPAGPAGNRADKTEPPPAEAAADALAGTDLHALLYARLLERETVDDAALARLAEHRAQAVVAGLVAAGAPSERIRIIRSEAFQGEGGDVPVKLELGVAGKP